MNTLNFKISEILSPVVVAKNSKNYGSQKRRLLGVVNEKNFIKMCLKNATSASKMSHKIESLKMTSKILY